MTVLCKPLRKKRALLIAIRHVDCKDGSNLANLEFAHRDAQDLRDLLIASHRYHADDIILMMDDKRHPKHLWPTRKRILQQIDVLTSDAPEECHFFFYFSGHGLEVEVDEYDRASMRADGRDGEIICADGKPILDYVLHNRLVTPLEKVKGSKLFALFDCCHSENLLDLQKGNGPNCYSKVWKVGPGQLFKDLTTSMVNLLKSNKKHRGVPPLVLRRASSNWCSTGPTYTTKETGELSVISLSACRDGQSAHDDCERELTFTKCFMNAVAAKPNVAWTELRDVLKELISGIRTRYEDACLQDPDRDGSTQLWTQEPRYSTSSHTDLTQRMTF